MFLVRPSYEIMSEIDADRIYKTIERAGRVCYKSEDRTTEDSAARFVKMIVQSGHHSVIEHVSVAVKFVVDRGVSHELVRHRICSFSQESTRFCNYGRKGVTFVIPPWVNLEPGLWEGIPTTIGDGIDSVTDRAWLESMSWAEEHYNFLLAQGWKPEQARAVLPNSLKTEIVCTANLREWKHIFQERTTPRAHPQMREVMVPLRDELTEKLPLIFA